MNIRMVNLLLCEAHNALLNFLRSNLFKDITIDLMSYTHFQCLIYIYIHMKTLTPSQLINLTAQTINSMFEN